MMKKKTEKMMRMKKKNKMEKEKQLLPYKVVTLKNNKNPIQDKINKINSKINKEEIKEVNHSINRKVVVNPSGKIKYWIIIY